MGGEGVKGEQYTATRGGKNPREKRAVQKGDTIGTALKNDC